MCTATAAGTAPFSTTTTWTTSTTGTGTPRTTPTTTSTSTSTADRAAPQAMMGGMGSPPQQDVSGAVDALAEATSRLLAAVDAAIAKGGPDAFAAPSRL